MNIVPEHSFTGGVKLHSSESVPFPPMPLKTMMEMLNVSQKVPKSFLQSVLMSSDDEDTIRKYE